MAELYDDHAVAAERLERLRGDARLRAERIDLLRFQAGEIAAARPVAGEEEELRRSRDLLRHREAIARALGEAFALLYEGDEAVADRLAQARHALAEVAQWEATAGAAIPELVELESRVQELARELRSRLDDAESEPGRLDEIEDRLALLERLFRKYGESSVLLLESQQRLRSELAELDDSEENRAALEAAASSTLEAYRASASELSQARGVWSDGARRAARTRACRPCAGTSPVRRQPGDAAALGQRAGDRRCRRRVRTARFRPCRVPVRSESRRADAAVVAHSLGR